MKAWIWIVLILGILTIVVVLRLFRKKPKSADTIISTADLEKKRIEDAVKHDSDEELLSHFNQQMKKGGKS